VQSPLSRSLSPQTTTRDLSTAIADTNSDLGRGDTIHERDSPDAERRDSKLIFMREIAMIRGRLTERKYSFFEPFVTEAGPPRGRPLQDHRRVLDGIFGGRR
jgi:hypothetical protein